jgi:hypothetical protein
MSVPRASLVFLLCASAALAADAPELRPLKGDRIKGDLVRVTDKEIVLQVGGKPVATPTEQALVLDLGSVTSPRDVTYTEVELVDGSLLRCGEVSYKGKEATLKLLSGQSVKVPMELLSYVMGEANDPKLAAQWKDLFGGKKRTYDSVVGKKDGALFHQEGTIYDASADGTTIDFLRKGKSEKAKYRLENIHGMVFVRPPDPKMPPMLCRVSDTQGSTLMAKSVTFQGGTFTVTTQCGVKAEYALPLLAKLDYSKGKLTYLSDLELARVKVVDNSEYTKLVHLRRDRNPYNEGQIRLAGTAYPKGLALHPRCEVTFDLNGDYREFRAVVGVDDCVRQGGDAPTALRVEGDGKELLNMTVSRKDGPKPVSLNIREVQKLRIVVTSDDVFGLGYGHHVDLADARVSK